MAYTFTPTNFSAALGPYALDINDCIGDSVGIINANTNYLASYTASVSSNLTSAINSLTTSVNSLSSTGAPGSVVGVTYNTTPGPYTSPNILQIGDNDPLTISTGWAIPISCSLTKSNNTRVVGRISVPLQPSNSRSFLFGIFRSPSTLIQTIPVYILNNGITTAEIPFIDTNTSGGSISYILRVAPRGGNATIYINQYSSGDSNSGSFSMLSTLTEIRA